MRDVLVHGTRYDVPWWRYREKAVLVSIGRVWIGEPLWRVTWKREREIFILRNWFMHLWSLASPKSVGWGWLTGWRPREELTWQSTLQGYLLVEVPLAQRKQTFLFYPVLQLIGWGPPTSWWAICFTQSPLIQMLISPQSIETSTIMFEKIYGHNGLAKLTQKINQYTKFILDEILVLMRRSIKLNHYHWRGLTSGS